MFEGVLRKILRTCILTNDFLKKFFINVVKNLSKLLFFNMRDALLKLNLLPFQPNQEAPTYDYPNFRLEGRTKKLNFS